jgi:hypothetical protein
MTKFRKFFIKFRCLSCAFIQAKQHQKYRNKSKINDSVSEIVTYGNFENKIVTEKFCVMVYNIKKPEKSCRMN